MILKLFEWKRKWWCHGHNTGEDGIGNIVMDSETEADLENNSLGLIKGQYFFTKKIEIFNALCDSQRCASNFN